MSKRSLRCNIDELVQSFPIGCRFTTQDLYDIIHHKSATKLGISNILSGHPKLTKVEGTRPVVWEVAE